jgi:hypothetical protein
MKIRNWREWFVPPEEETPAHQTEDEVRVVAGVGHRSDDKPLHLRRKLPPRCAKCKKFMGHDDGMHIMLTHDWRVHIKCFNEVVSKHLEEGESLDLTTGQIVKTKQDEFKD